MPPSFFSPDTTWTGTQILLSEQHCPVMGDFVFSTQQCPSPIQGGSEYLTPSLVNNLSHLSITR